MHCWGGGAAWPASSGMADGGLVTKVNHFYNGMITLPDAARKYGASADRIRWWIKAERIARMGYLRGGSPQGGYVLLVEAELAALLGEA